MLLRFLLSRCLCLGGLALGATSVATAAERQPNVILIMADDFGYECVTANGGQSYQTPHLDRLAATGMRFENCHVQPLCTPTRVQLMTGLYNVRNYVDFGTLDRKQTTFAHIMKKAGYVTGVGGKWQLGAEKDSPQHFGFDESLLWQQTRRPPRYANPGLERNGVEIDYTKGEYGPKLINDFALEFITKNKDRPFFFYYPMILTHNPFQPTPDSAEWDPKTTGEAAKQNPKHMADMTVYMDKMVGRLVAKLEELGLRENTLVLFLGDNGTHVEITSRFKGQDYPGGKGTSTVRGTHVPLIANWPGKIAAGKVNHALISSVDFVPTIAGLARAPIPGPTNDGHSFLPQLLGQPAKPREWLYSWYARNGGGQPQWEYAMTATHKLYRDGRFFDLAVDRYEEKPPLAVATLSGPTAAAAKVLQGALDQHAKSRPAHLMAATAAGDGDEGAAKKKGKGKKKA